jgi:uncharacterized protein (TIGR03083 family)
VARSGEARPTRRRCDLARVLAEEDLVADARSWTYEEACKALGDELRALQDLLASLSDEDWDRPTRCRWNPDRPWNVRALVAHINISIGMTPGFVADRAQVSPEKDRVGFFINEPRLTSPIVDKYAWLSADSQSPAELRRAFDNVVDTTVNAARETPADATAPVFFGAMTMGEFLPTRVLEAVVHGHDVSEAVGRPPHMTPVARAMTVKILEDLLARRAAMFFPLMMREAGAMRPADLDDVAYIEVATGRRPSSDGRFPLMQ